MTEAESTDLKREINLFIWSHAPASLTLERAEQIATQLWELLTGAQPIADPRITEGMLRCAARKIANALFRARDGQVATRLVMEAEPGERDLGGWSEDAVISRVHKILVREFLP